MTALVPAPALSPGALLAPLRSGRGVSFSERLSEFAAQPPVRKALPWFAGLSALGLIGLAWAGLSSPPQRVLYSQLSDAERASVVAALDTAAVDYAIDSQTGALTVGENDFYRAKMLVASDGALAAPESGTQMLDALPMGASRTLEGDRLRAAQERDLTLTIQEIDGVDAVRVHLARAERSVFVRDNVPPSASVMIRMARGRQMSDQQVIAVANLVAGSVPGLAIDAVRVVDQHGRLLSQPKGPNADRFDLQSRLEAKMNAQVEQLLAPMIGSGNFSSEVQVELDMNEVTSARESYDKDGAIRRESLQSSQSTQGSAVGVPGVLSNTPPPTATAVPGAPQGGPVQGAAQGAGENSSTRSYELGREVAVSNVAPGNLRRLSIAVAINQDAFKGAKKPDIATFKELVAAAVGADTARGDKVAVVVRPFRPVEIEPTPFWETGWFATVLRHTVTLIAVLLLVFLVLRPVVRRLTAPQASRSDGLEQSESQGTVALQASLAGPEQLTEQIALAQRIVREKPDDALLALRRMLNETPQPAEEARL